MELRKYWEIFCRRKWIFIQSLIIIVATTIVVCEIMTPVYDATSKILVLKEAEDLSVSIPGLSPDVGVLNAISPEMVTTQMEIMTSGHIMNKVIHDLNLTERETIIQKVLGLITRKKEENRESRFVRVKDFADAGYLTAFLQGRWVTVESEMESDVIKVIGVSSDRHEAMEIANTVAEVYVNAMQALSKSQASDSSEFIRKQLLRTKAELETAEKELRLHKEKLEKVSTSQSKLEDTGEYVFSSKVVEDNPKIQELTSKLYDLETKLAGLMTEFSAEHPDVISLSAQIKIVRDLLKDELELILSSETMLFNKYYEQFKTKEKTYNMLLEQLDSALLAESMSLVNARIIETAELPREGDPLYPSLILYAIISVFVGVLFGLGLAFLVEYLDDRIHDPDELEESSGLPVLGRIPLVRRRVAQKVLTKRESVFTKATWRLQLNLKELIGGNKVIAVVSPFREEGKSTICVHLGVLFARSRLKTLLIDFNLRRPTLHKAFRVRGKTGLMGAVRNRKSEKVQIHETPYENLSLMTCGSSRLSSFDILNSPHLPQVVEKLRSEYDLILIDTSDIHGGNDALIVSAQADHVLLVASIGKVILRKLKGARESLENTGSKIVGLVINRCAKQ
jgi:capsular exopolysaccharide synthesis family protein